MSNANPYQIAERRLRPIYDWLDNGNNKKALQEADKVLKKQPKMLCARVLKGLALLRLGKESDSTNILESVRREYPTDEATLQALSVCYNEINQPEVICEIYKEACGKEPNNEDIRNSLFLSYLRVSDYAKQQSTAVALYKLKQKNQYCCWAVMSILLQALSVDDLQIVFLPPLGPKPPIKPRDMANNKMIMLKLAGKMIDKLVDENRINSEQEMLLYLAVLELHERYDDALNVLDSPMSLKLEKTFVNEKRVQLLIQKNQWDLANVELKHMMSQDLESMYYVRAYIRSVLKLSKNDIAINDLHKDADNSIEKATDNFQHMLLYNEQLKHRCRGAYLAKFEFYSELKKNGYDISKFENVSDMFMRYIKEFGHLECCLPDLKSYICLITDEVAEALLLELKSYVGLEEGEYPENQKQMGLHIFNLEFVLCLGLGIDVKLDEKCKFVETLVRYYIYSLKFSKDMPSTQSRLGDHYIILAVHSLYELWVDSNDSNYLFDGIILCLYGLKNSPTNAQLRLLIIKFYHIIGFTREAHEQYLLLDIKYMQLDSLGYMHVSPLLSMGEISFATSILNTTLNFYRMNYKDSADHMTLAYRYEAYSKIPEFLDTRDRFFNSINNKVFKVEKYLVDLLFNASSPSNAAETVFLHLRNNNTLWLTDEEFKRLYDTRDLNIIWEMQPETRRITVSEIEQTKNHDIVYAKLRSTVLEIICYISQICNKGKNDKNEKENIEIDNNDKITQSLIEKTNELDKLLESLKKNVPKAISNYIIGAPPDSRLLNMLKYSYFHAILYQVQFLIGLIPDQLKDSSHSQSHLDYLNVYFTDISNVLSGMFECDYPIRKRDLIQLSTIYVEIISFSCIVQETCERIVKQLKTALTRKNKKKKDTNLNSIDNDVDWRIDLITKFNNCVRNSVNSIETKMTEEETKWKSNNKILNLTTLNNLDNNEELDILESLSKCVTYKLNASYRICLSNILSFLKMKEKYLSNYTL